MFSNCFSFRCALTLFTAVVALGAVAPAVANAAAPGDLDTTYDTDGVSVQGADDFSALSRLTLDPDGSSVFVAATSGPGARTRYLVRRVNSAGLAGASGSGLNTGPSHHTTFADLQRITTGDHAGKYVGVLRSDDGLTLVRLLSTLQPDTSFGNALGEVVLAPPAESHLEAGLVVDGAGNYVLVTNPSFGGGARVWRATPAGALDATFGGGDGIVTVLPGAAVASDIGLTSEGAIVVGGNQAGNPVAARLTPAGVLDPTFGGDGVADPISFASFDTATELLVQADDKVVVGGGSARFDLVRWNDDGSVDTSFSDDGKVSTVGSSCCGGSGATGINALAQQADGRIVAGGRMQGTVDNKIRIAIARYEADGSLDTTFGTNGLVRDNPDTGVAPRASIIKDLVIQADGRILTAVARTGAGGAQERHLIRYLGGRPPTASFTRSIGAPVIGEPVTFNSTSGAAAPATVTSSTWDVDGDGFDDGSGSSFPHTFNVTGDYQVRLRVVDSDGYEDIETVTVTVGVAPTVTISAPEEATFGEPVEIFAIATPSGSIVSYVWDLDNDGQYDDDAGQSIDFPASQLGPDEVEVRVTDNRGRTADATVDINVLGLPVPSFTVSNQTPTAGDAVTYTSTSTHGSDLQLTYEWDFESDGTVDATTAVATYTHQVAGTHTVRLTASDVRGVRRSVTHVMTVAAKGAPPVVATPVETPPASVPPLTPSPFPTIESIAGTLTVGFVAGVKQSTRETAKMADYVAKRFTVDQVQADLGLARDLNVRYKLKPGPLVSLPAARRASAKPYEVFSTKPAKGAALTSGFPAPAQVVELSYYDPAVPKDANCPYANGKVKSASGTLDVWAVVRGLGVFEGADLLDDLGCNFEITGVDYVRNVDESALYKFTAAKVKGKQLLRVRIGSPKQPDFRATFNEPIHPGFETQLGLANDGSVIAADQTHNTGVTVIERATARLVQNLPVKLLAPNGDVIAAGKTNTNGFVHLQYSFPQRAGQLRLVMEHVEPRTSEVLMSAVQTFQIVHRPEGWTDMNGNRMVRDGSGKLVRYVRTGAVQGRAKVGGRGGQGRALTTSADADLYEALRQSLVETYTVIFRISGMSNRPLAEFVADTIVQAIKQATSEQVARQTGLSVGILGNSQAPLSTSGALATGSATAALSVANAAGGLQALSGGGIISGGAGNIISGGAGNIISGGAGNIISGGAGNIISGGAGNIISGGGGNIISGGAGNIISGGAGNIISGGAGNFKSVTGKLRPFVAAAQAFLSTRYTADVRSYKVREIEDTTVIVNLDGSLPSGTIVSQGLGMTPITFPGKLR